MLRGRCTVGCGQVKTGNTAFGCELASEADFGGGGALVLSLPLAAPLNMRGKRFSGGPRRTPGQHWRRGWFPGSPSPPITI